MGAIPSFANGSLAGRKIMLYTRRDIGKIALAAVPASMAFGATINSKFGGVQIGAITYSFRSMGGDPEAIVKAYVEIGLGEMELMSNDCEALARRAQGCWPGLRWRSRSGTGRRSGRSGSSGTGSHGGSRCTSRAAWGRWPRPWRPRSTDPRGAGRQRRCHCQAGRLARLCECRNLEGRAQKDQRCRYRRCPALL